MRHQLLEAWVLDVVDRVTAGRALEDDRVELKAQWPDNPRKTARRIGGHANQAGGDMILWLIGVDETSRTVVDAGTVEMADWWPKVQRCFDELPPSLQHLGVPAHGGTVHALLIDTSRAPYLVTTDGHGGVEREVPWREGNRTRTARRSELLRSVVEEVQVPTLECFDGLIEFVPDNSIAETSRNEADLDIYISLNLYMEAPAPCTMPEHRWAALLTVGDQTIDATADLGLEGPTRPIPRQGDQQRFRAIDFFTRPTEPVGEIVAVRNSGLRVAGSDAVELTANVTMEHSSQVLAALRNRQRITFHLTLPLANSARAATMTTDLYRTAATRNTRERSIATFAVRDAR